MNSRLALSILIALPGVAYATGGGNYYGAVFGVILFGALFAFVAGLVAGYAPAKTRGGRLALILGGLVACPVLTWLLFGGPIWQATILIVPVPFVLAYKLGKASREMP